MTRKTKLIGSTTGFLAVAAFSGLLAGATSHASASTTKNLVLKNTITAKAGVKALDTPSVSHDCKGKNDCKGTGGCSAGDNGCKGKNSCKGKGGCKSAAPSTQPGLL